MTTKPQIKKGSRIYDGDGEARVIGVVERYLVARRKGAVPFLVALREIDSSRWVRWTTKPREAA